MSDEQEKPDLASAREQLEKVRRQWPDVEALARRLMTEKSLNDFTANVVATFRGGRR